jgi:gamma-glutamyl:cysteine ligase YbdK (ATP-grasp superfamily)
MSSRGNARTWGWVLIALAVAAPFWAGLEWWYQSNGQQVLDGMPPADASTMPVDWDQERQQSQVRMALALIVAAASSVSGVLLLKRRSREPASVA